MPAILTSLRLAKRFSEASTFSIRNLADTGAREATAGHVTRRSDVSAYVGQIVTAVPTPKPVHVRLANRAKYIWKAVKDSSSEPVIVPSLDGSIAGEQ